MKLWTISVLFMSLAAQTMAYNILVLAPFGSWSEYKLAKILGDSLAGVGHKVTLVSGFGPSNDSLITEIFVGSSINEAGNIFELDMMQIISYASENQKRFCNSMYTNNDVLDIWKHRNDFDAIIAFSVINEIIAPFLIEYTGTYIGLCPIGIEGWQISNQGNRLPKSVTPFTLANFDENMNFLERVLNVLLELVIWQMYDYDMVPQIQTLLENYFPGMPPAVDLYRNYSLLLINSHFAMDGIYPLLPNQVEIGTLTATLPQPLSMDLQEFVDGAAHGIIYFSLGSYAKSTDIPKTQMAMLLEAFGRLPQHVIWKFEGDHIVNLPSNVITRKWLPQQDILGHPQTLVLISHCGTFGIQEATFHGVPVLGVPISFDQHRNAARLARKGYGLFLNWDEMTVELIVENINILIKDNTYRERLQAMSHALQDQKESPKERAMWWIEYAIRHKGAPHMHYAGKNLNVIQYNMVDVWIFLIVILMSCVSLSYYCLRICCRKGLCRKPKQE
ncbi:unnamed protein product [Meganyctiphanes norvegica]|uniref:Glucuronosyltransferase n=1 Tax=Meganyctiphanes norvegica TaxID=48144 RepID=A0AAV2QRZ3_MEGNR